MPSRIIPLVNEQIYHIYNRGTEKRTIFENRRDYQRFLKTLQYYQFQGPKPKFSHFSQPKSLKVDLTKKIIEIIAYCLMPNHFHLLIKQIREGGITEFVSKLSNSYTKYFNIKHDRVGSLLQGEFKAKLIENDDQLLHVQRYIHLNPVASFLVKKPEDWEWSSYNEYLGNTSTQICSKEIVLNFFKSIEDFKKFTEDQIDYAQKLELLKHQLIDIEDE